MRILSRRLFVQVAAAVAAAVATPVLSATPPPDYDFELEVTEFGYRAKIRGALWYAVYHPPLPHLLVPRVTGLYAAPDFLESWAQEHHRSPQRWYFHRNSRTGMMCYLQTKRLRHRVFSGNDPVAKEVWEDYHDISASTGVPGFLEHARADARWHLKAVTDTHSVFECYDPYDARRIICGSSIKDIPSKFV